MQNSAVLYNGGSWRQFFLALYQKVVVEFIYFLLFHSCEIYKFLDPSYPCGLRNFKELGIKEWYWLVGVEEKGIRQCIQGIENSCQEMVSFAFVHMACILQEIKSFSINYACCKITFNPQVFFSLLDCRNVAFAFVHMMMGLSCVNFLAAIIFIAPAQTSGCI